MNSQKPRQTCSPVSRAQPRRWLAIWLAASVACVTTACDYSDFYNPGDAIDATLADIPFNTPDDWVPSDGGGSGFAITSASPTTGPMAGGTRVSIEGRGFTTGARVLFGSSEGVETVVENEYSIKSTTPGGSGYSETVDVWVVRADGKKTVLRPGFAYRAEVAVDSITPSSGPVSGGTPVTITGSGFAPDSDVIIDGRSALQVNRIGDTTILAVTPPGEAGDVEVMVLSGTASGRLGRAFTYVQAPSGVTCSPGVVNMAGTDDNRLVDVLLTGENIDGVQAVSVSSGRVVSFSAPSTTGRLLRIDFSEVPTEGPVEVTLAGPGGTVSVPACFTALEKDSIDDATLRVWAMAPGSSNAKGGETGTLTVTGLDVGSPSSLLVTLGTGIASVTEVPDMNTVRFVIPGGAPGVVDVKLESPAETAVLTDGFTYLNDAQIAGVDPSTAPPGGGTDAVVTGTGLADAVEVLVGPLPALITGQPDDTSIPIRIPAVGPGVHDVTVEFADGGRAVARDALTCASDELQVKAITPSRGSLAGGTLVYVTGAGLVPGTRVFFGDYEATVVSDNDPGRMSVLSPAGEEEGVVDVFVVDNDGVRQRLSGAFTYFNPTGFLGGTWGGDISGSVNVTVIDSYNDTPVPQAFVMLDSDPSTPYRGFTDARGMITLSGKGLKGPVMVTATRQDYTTWSIAGVDAENITINLEPLVNQIPTDDGDGDDDDNNVFPLTPGLITGNVIGTDKEFIVPPGSCAGMPLTHGTMCAACGDDGDCGADSLCVLTGATAMTCSRPCTISGDCPDGYDCYQAGEQGTVCKPTPGTEEVRCGVADSTSLRWADNFGPGALMTPAGTYALNSRLGDVAVYCLGGYRRTGDGVFVPVIMGLLRHLNVETSTISSGNNVRLNIPLSRTLRVRMIAPPGGPGGPTVHTTYMTLRLGSDGYLNLWPAIATTDGTVFDIEDLPSDFTGALDNTTISISAEATSPNDSDEPYSVVLPQTWTPWSPEPFQVLDGWTADYPVDAVLDVISGCSSDTAGVVIDATHRAWIVAADSSITALPSIGMSDITACTWTDDGLVAFTGAGSRVYFYDPVMMDYTTERTDSGSTGLDVAQACGDRLWLAGDGRLYTRSGDGAWTRIRYGTPAPLYDIACMPDGTMVGVGPDGTIVQSDGFTAGTVVIEGLSTDLYSVVQTGTDLFITGALGTILAGRSTGDLATIYTGLLDDLTVSAPDGTGGVVVGGTRGIVVKVSDGVATVIRDPGDDAEVTALIGTPSVGGDLSYPIQAFRRTSVMAGPFVNIPDFGSPPENWLWLDSSLTWSIKTPPAPSFFYIRMYTVGMTGRWSILANGNVREIRLPDLATASGLALRPLKSGTVSLWNYTILSSGFDMDNYDSTSLYTSQWDAWSATGFLTSMF